MSRKQGYSSARLLTPAQPPCQGGICALPRSTKWLGWESRGSCGWFGQQMALDCPEKDKLFKNKLSRVNHTALKLSFLCCLSSNHLKSAGGELFHARQDHGCIFSCCVWKCAADPRLEAGVQGSGKICPYGRHPGVLPAATCHKSSSGG